MCGANRRGVDRQVVDRTLVNWTVGERLAADWIVADWIVANCIVVDGSITDRVVVAHLACQSIVAARRVESHTRFAKELSGAIDSTRAVYFRSYAVRGCIDGPLQVKAVRLDSLCHFFINTELIPTLLLVTGPIFDPSSSHVQIVPDALVVQKFVFNGVVTHRNLKLLEIVELAGKAGS